MGAIETEDFTIREYGVESQVRNKSVLKRKGKGREGAGCGVRWSRQMVGGCVSNQPGDGSESSNTKSTEILTIKTRVYILTTGQPKRLSTPSSCQKSIVLLTPTNRPK